MRTLVKICFTMAILLPVLALASDRFYCSGTEPFWSIVAAHDEFTFQLSPNPPQNFAPLTAMKVKYVTQNNLQVYKTKSLDKKQPAWFIVQKMNCSDGMSDHKYDFQAIFIVGDTVHHGCCMRKEIEDLELDDENLSPTSKEKDDASF